MVISNAVFWYYGGNIWIWSDSMNGYIGITSREWYEFLVEHQIHNEINFWRKNTNQFKVLKPGEPFFFLVKNVRELKPNDKCLDMQLLSGLKLILFKRHGIHIKSAMEIIITIVS